MSNKDVMSRQDDINDLIKTYTRRLQIRKQQQAQLGISTPPYVVMDIEDIENELERLQKELEQIQARESPTPQSSSPVSNQSDDAITFPNIDIDWGWQTERDKPFVNRYEELRLFEQMLNSSSNKPILLFYGQGDMGKSVLMDEFFYHCQGKRIPCIFTDFSKEFTLEVILINFFSQIYDVLGDELLGFVKYVNELIAIIPEDVPKTAPMSEKITKILRQPRTPNDDYPGWLTQSLFNDLREVLSTKLVMLFDTYDQANDDWKKWLNDQILAKTPLTDNIITIIAGRKLPEKKREWAIYYTSQELEPIMDIEAWHKVHSDISREKIKELCEKFGGKPGMMAKGILLEKGGTDHDGFY